MENKELLTKLIAHYEKGIAQIQGMAQPRSIAIYLNENWLDLGVCFCAENKFRDGGLYLAKWVHELSHKEGPDYGYWGPVPAEGQTKDEVIKALQFRVDIMKNQLNK